VKNVKTLTGKRARMRVPANSHPYYHRLDNAAATLNLGLYLAACDNIITELNASKVPGPVSALFGQWMNLTGLYYFGESCIVENAATGDNWMPAIAGNRSFVPSDMDAGDVR
jgi:hypothetical protein